MNRVDELILEQVERMASVEEKAASAHKRLEAVDRRLDKMEGLVETIHKMTANVEVLAQEVKKLRTDMVDDVKILRADMKRSFETQGARIGEMKESILSFDSLREKVEVSHDLVHKLEKKPGEEGLHKWNRFIWLIVSSVAAIIGSYLVGRFL